MFKIKYGENSEYNLYIFFATTERINLINRIYLSKNGFREE